MDSIDDDIIEFIDLTQDVADATNTDIKVTNRVLSMFEKGCTVPFIARYRKEATGSMTPEALRRMKESFDSLKNVKELVDKSIKQLRKSDQLTEGLSKQLSLCKSADEVKLLTDPFKSKGGPRTLAARAKAAGLEPIAQSLLAGNFIRFDSLAVDMAALKGVSVTDAVGHVIAELLSSDLELLRLAEQLCQTNVPNLETKPVKRKNKKQVKPEKNCNEQSSSNRKKSQSITAKSSSQGGRDESQTYSQYLNISRPLTSLEPHQILAINRAADRGFLTARIILPFAVEQQCARFVQYNYSPRLHPCHRGLLMPIFNDAWLRLIEPHLGRLLRTKLTAKAHDVSLEIFVENLRRLLMTPPLKATSSSSPSTPQEATRVACPIVKAPACYSSSSSNPSITSAGRIGVIGLDPGLAHGCKWAACGQHGEVLATGLLWPPTSRAKYCKSGDNGLGTLLTMMRRYNIEIIALGDGVGSRPAGLWLSHLISSRTFTPLNVRYAIVGEDGASIYSASPLACSELPQLDVTFRGAVSIARRLQDPLSELVKIDPKHLGVGMYQHDLPERRLIASVDSVLQECISFVGVDVNTAPTHVLARVSGLSEVKAKAIVAYRNKLGNLTCRAELREIKGIGPSTYAQCAGFIRVRPYQNDSAVFKCQTEVIELSSDEEEAERDIWSPITSSPPPPPVIKTPGKRKASTSKDQKIKRTRTFQFNPLDQTAVHPDTYEIASKIIKFLGFSLTDVGKSELRSAALQLANSQDCEAKLGRFCTKEYGMETLCDILVTLGRPLDFDERQDNFQPLFHNSVQLMTDLRLGHKVSGRVKNVTTFGAFADIGVDETAYIPRFAYPVINRIPVTSNGFTGNRSATGPSSTSTMSLCLGDRFTATVSQLDTGRRRIGLKDVVVIAS